MGNVVKRVTNRLRDPYLVRRIQETFGVKQIVVPNESKCADTAKCTSDVHVVSNDPVVNGEVRYGGTMEWLASKAKVRHHLKPSPSTTPPEGTPSSSDVENTQELPEIAVESIPILDIYFRIATECGYEPFYITVIPFIIWNIDMLMSRQVVFLWVLSMYVGQACKQLFKWKRPSCPPALRMENNPELETEYGFPSTHAIVSTTIPFYYLYRSYGRYQFPLWVGLLIAFTWCISVCFSRIYLGVHTVMDIIGGIFISVIILSIMAPLMDTLDHFILYSDASGAVVIAITIIFLLYIYPVNPDKWTMDRGDTAAILGVGLGYALGSWMSGPTPDDLDPGPFEISVPSLNLVGICLVRFVVGVLLLLPSRFVMKLLCFKLLPLVMPTHGVEEVVKRPLVELPYKIITYGTIGFNATYLAAIVFEICNISRWEEGTAW